MCLTVPELCFLQNGDLFIYCLKNIVCCPMMRGGREKNSVCCQIILRLMLRRSHCFDALEGDPSLSERVGLRCKEGASGGKYSIWEISHQGKPPVFHVRNQCSLLLTSISINQPKPRLFFHKVLFVYYLRGTAYEDTQ